MRVRWLAVFSCLLAAFALGMTACGDDDDDDGGGGDSGGDGGGTVNVYSSLPLQGASRPQTTAMVDGIKLALKQARQQGRRPDHQVHVARRLDRAGGHVDARGHLGQRAQGRSGRRGRRLHRRVQLGRERDLDPAAERGADRPDQPGEHRRGPDLGRAGRRRGRAGQVLPDGQAPLPAHRPEGHDPGRRAGDAHEGGRLRQRRTSSTTRRCTARACRATSRTPPKEQGLEVLANEGIDPKAPNFRSQAAAMKSAGAECFVFSGITANGAVQLYKDVVGGPSGRQALRARRCGRVRLRRPGRGRHPGGRGQQGPGHGGHAVAGRVPAGGPEVLLGLRGRVRRAEPGSVRDLRLRGDEASCSTRARSSVRTAPTSRR